MLVIWSTLLNIYLQIRRFHSSFTSWIIDRYDSIKHTTCGYQVIGWEVLVYPTGGLLFLALYSSNGNAWKLLLNTWKNPFRIVAFNAWMLVTIDYPKKHQRKTSVEVFLLCHLKKTKWVKRNRRQKKKNRQK